MNTLTNAFSGFFSRFRAKPAGGQSGRGRRHGVEILESRIALSYTFALSGTTATVTGSAAVDSLVIDVTGGGLLEHSVNGGAFSTDWDSTTAGVQTLAAAALSTVNITFSTGNGSSLTLGTPSGPASHLLASFSVQTGSNTTDTVTIDDSGAAVANTYVMNTGSGVITGTGIHYDEPGVSAFAGGITVLGAPVNGDVFTVSSSYTNEPVTILAGGVGLTTVNVGTGSLGLMGAALAVHASAGGSVTLNINDQSDVSHGTATIDNLSGNSNAFYEVTGLSTAAIEYGSGVTAVNITGGTSAAGTAGVNFNINGTQSGTTLTITGGGNQNHFNLSNSGEVGGLDNLPGPVVIHGGGSFSDTVTLEDSHADFNDSYTVTSTTVGRIVFGGLTYDSIGTLTLNAENALGTDGNNTIDITSTADSITTNINGQGGNDTITVHDTGSFGSLVITTGNGGSTVNVLADHESVSIHNNGLDTINIGSTGGAGTLDNILADVTILNVPDFNTVNIHDELSSIGKTWTINADNTANTESVAATGVGLISFRPGDLSALTIGGSTGVNVFNVNGSAQEVTTTIQGNGSDTFIIAGSGLGFDSNNDFVGSGPQATFNLSPVSSDVGSVTFTGNAPLVFPGDELIYSGPGVINPMALGNGFIGQTGFLPVSFTGMDVVATNLFGLASTPGGFAITVAGDQDYAGEADQFAIQSVGPLIQVSNNGAVGYYGDPAAVFQIDVNGLAGNDDLTVDSTSTLATVAGGIHYTGGAGFNTLHITQTGGTTQTSDTYTPGPNAQDVRSVIVGPSGTQTIFAQDVVSLTDTVPASSLIVNGTPANNAITSIKGLSAGSGTVSIDNFAPIQYSGKTSLTINGDGGSDSINGFSSANVNSHGFNAAGVYDLTTSTTGGKATPGLGPVQVVTGQLTGSGFDDIVTVNQKTGNISVLINNGNGTFEAPVVFKSGGLKPDGLVLGNFDAHPGLDLAVTNSGSGDIAIFSGNGLGGFGAPTIVKTAADPTAIAAGFINGDANEDLVVTNSSLGAITVLLGNGAGGFTPTTSIKTPIKVGGKDPVAVAIADFNNDSDADIVTANNGSATLSFLAGNGSGGFAAPTLFAVGPKPTGLAVGDINNDGNLDVALSSGTKNIVSILYGNGAGPAATQFQFREEFAVPGTTANSSIVLADFNGDGHLDVGLGSTTGGTFSILLGTASGAFSQPYQMALGTNTAITAVVADDLTHDGLIDIIAASQNSNNVSVLQQAV